MAVQTANKREQLVGVREQRRVQATQFEVRDVAGSDVVITGYASTYAPYEMYGGPAAGGWIEQLDRRAFDKTLTENPTVHLLINHDGMPLASTKSGTLTLSSDDRGLKMSASLDRCDPDVQKLLPKLARGDMDEMSFAFRVKGQGWSAAPGYEETDQYSMRTITAVSLHQGDVSVVNFGANPDTSVALSAERALEKLAGLDPRELRRLDRDQLRSIVVVVTDDDDEEDDPEDDPLDPAALDSDKPMTVAAARSLDARRGDTPTGLLTIAQCRSME